MAVKQWLQAYPHLQWQAQLKAQDEDFVVKEELSFKFDDSTAEHLYIYFEKQSLTSYQLIQIVADYFNVEAQRIGCAGLKDKNAITRQWLSVYLPGKRNRLDHEMLLGSQLVTQANAKMYKGQCRILDCHWHQSKLRRGAIAQNCFKIRLRGSSEVPAEIFERLQLLSVHGFPNYFGKQRFGIEGNNISQIETWFVHQKIPPQTQQSILLSAARAYLFNHILHRRISLQNWNLPTAGDYFSLQGSRQFFQCAEIDEVIFKRCAQGDIHPSGSLWGTGDNKISAKAAVIETKVEQLFQTWCRQLEERKIQRGYRALRCLPQNLQWQLLSKTDLQIDFCLPSGSYATALLSELGDVFETPR